MNDDRTFSEPQGDLSVRIGREQIDIERHWEAASILNDILAGVAFVTGSVLNLWTDLETLALSFYLGGSLFLLGRAVLSLSRRIHVQRHMRRSRPKVLRPSRTDSA